MWCQQIPLGLSQIQITSALNSAHKVTVVVSSQAQLQSGGYNDSRIVHSYCKDHIGRMHAMHFAHSERAAQVLGVAIQGNHLQVTPKQTQLYAEWWWEETVSDFAIPERSELSFKWIRNIYQLGRNPNLVLG